MDLSQRKEQYSRAFVHTVATVAGFTIYNPQVDDDSIDLGIASAGKQGTHRSPRLELQLKCTSSVIVDRARFPLKLKNYNELRRDCLVPRILVVVFVPERIENWLSETDEKLVMHRRAFWVSLNGSPESANKYTVSVELPTSQPFSVNELDRLMNLIDRTDQL